MLKKVCVSLGGNQGNVDSTFDKAIELINDQVGFVCKQSSRYRTQPMGENAGDPFVNSALVLETSLSANEILDLLHSIESSLGRERSIHWGPRTLDLDLLLCDDLILDEPRIVVPHPAMWYRLFVLQPLAEIASDFVHPILGMNVRELLDRLLVRPLVFELCVDLDDQDGTVRTIQSEEQPNGFNNEVEEIEELIREPGLNQEVIVRLVESNEIGARSDDVFARLIIESASQFPTSADRPRSQPFLQEDFTIVVARQRLYSEVRGIISATCGV